MRYGFKPNSDTSQFIIKLWYKESRISNQSLIQWICFIRIWLNQAYKYNQILIQDIFLMTLNLWRCQALTSCAQTTLMSCVTKLRRAGSDELDQDSEKQVSKESLWYRLWFFFYVCFINFLSESPEYFKIRSKGLHEKIVYGTRSNILSTTLILWEKDCTIKQLCLPFLHTVM